MKREKWGFWEKEIWKEISEMEGWSKRNRRRRTISYLLRLEKKEK